MQINGGRRTVRIGMIGAGWIAEKAHLPSFKNLLNTELAGIYDADMEKATQLADRFGICKVYRGLDELLRADIDAVIIATPNNTHSAIALSALRHDKHVLCEKPVVLHTNEMHWIMKMAEAHKKIFMPAFVNRFRDDIGLLQDALNEEDLGQIKTVRAGWLRKNGVPRPGTWITHKKTAGGGALVDLGSHLLDICLMLLPGKTPVHTTGMFSYNYQQSNGSGANWIDYTPSQTVSIDVEDSVTARIEFEDEVRLSLELSWAAPVDNDLTYIHIEGTGGYLNLKTLFGFSTNRLYLHDQLVIRTGQTGIQKKILDRSRNAQQQAFGKMAAHFVSCIRRESSQLVTPEDGLRTVSVIEQLYKSYKEKAHVPA